MFLEILKQNNDGTLVKNENGYPIVSSLVNLDCTAHIYISQSNISGSSSDKYYVIAVLPGTVDQIRNTIADATNKKVLFFGSQKNCEEYLHTLNYDLHRNKLRLNSPAARITITPDEANK